MASGWTSARVGRCPVSTVSPPSWSEWEQLTRGSQFEDADLGLKGPKAIFLGGDCLRRALLNWCGPTQHVGFKNHSLIRMPDDSMDSVVVVFHGLRILCRDPTQTINKNSMPTCKQTKQPNKQAKQSNESNKQINQTNKQTNK